MLRCTIPTLFLLFFSGCAVGPDYHPPAVRIPVEFSEDQPDQTVFVEDEDLVGWWKIFNDPVLNDLLEGALSDSFDMRIAVEKIFEARALYRAQFASIFPNFDASNTFSRSKASQSFANSASLAQTGVSPYQNFYLFGFDAIWQLDLFGQLTRAYRSAYDLWEASVEDARSVKIVILSEVAMLYVTIRGYQQKLDVAARQVELDQELLDLATEKHNSGLAGQQDVEAFKAALHGDTALLNLTESLLGQTIYSLSTLLGRLPETLLEDFQEEAPIPLVSGKIPAGLPSDLLRRRPDIRGAERRLASATEDIGVAVADLFPKFSLTGSSSSFSANPLQGANYGFTSNTLNKLFSPLSSVWGFGTFINWPFFDFGKRRALVDVQVSLQHQALLNYEKSVVAAFQEVETALLTFFKDQERLSEYTKQLEANNTVLEMETDLYQSGLSDYTSVISAKERHLASLNAYLDTQQALTIDFISVYKALGGDW